MLPVRRLPRENGPVKLATPRSLSRMNWRRPRWCNGREHLLLQYDILILSLILIACVQIVEIYLVLLAHEVPHCLVHIILSYKLKVVHIYVKLLAQKLKVSERKNGEKEDRQN